MRIFLCQAVAILSWIDMEKGPFSYRFYLFFVCLLDCKFVWVKCRFFTSQVVSRWCLFVAEVIRSFLSCATPECYTPETGHGTPNVTVY